MGGTDRTGKRVQHPVSEEACFGGAPFCLKGNTPAEGEGKGREGNGPSFLDHRIQGIKKVPLSPATRRHQLR